MLIYFKNCKLKMNKILKRSLEGLVAVSLIAGCKAEKPEKPDIAGKWEGTYSRTSHRQVEDLTISFEEEGKIYFAFTDTYIAKEKGEPPVEYGTYKCIGEQQYLPPSGHGEYKIVDNKIILEDKAFRIANFDWTLVLNGEFDYMYKDGVLGLKQHDKKTNRYHNIILKKKLLLKRYKPL